MASIGNDGNGRRRILFVAGDGKRRTIRLGKVSQKIAESVKTRVEQLNAAKIAGHAVEADTARWLTTIDDSLRDKLAAAGLVAQRDRATTLGAFLDQYIAARTKSKPGTRTNLTLVKRNLVEYFGIDTPLRDITPGDADDWRLWMLDRLGDNTVRRRCGRAKQFFRAATRKRLIAESPFADMTDCHVRANRERFYYVTPEESAKVLAACIDGEWQLVFALARFGGLRCPSEHLKLRWADIHWETSRMTVHSPKTEHHEGGGSRVVPIFPELRPYLEAARDLAEPGAEFVIARYRDPNCNLRTRLIKTIKRAGLKPWPKVWQNLRQTRVNEVTCAFPKHVALEWMGHDEKTAQKFYLWAQEEHFMKAISPQGWESGTKSGTVTGQIGQALAQNQAQQPAAIARQEMQKSHDMRDLVQLASQIREEFCQDRMTPTGLEPVLPP